MPFQTLSNALSVVPIGGKLDVGAGTFYGNTIILNPCLIQGAGKYVTTLVDTNYSASYFFLLTNNFSIRDCGIVFSKGITNTASISPPFLIPKQGATNVTFYNTYAIGDSDVLVATAGYTNAFSGSVVNCSWYGFYDTIAIKAGSASLATNSTIYVSGSDFHTAGDSYGFLRNVQVGGLVNNFAINHCMILSGFYGMTNAVTLVGNWFDSHDSGSIDYCVDLGGADDGGGQPVYAQISGNVFNSGYNVGTNIAWLITDGDITTPDYEDIYLSNGSQINVSGVSTNNFKIKNLGATNGIWGFQTNFPAASLAGTLQPAQLNGATNVNMVNAVTLTNAGNSFAGNGGGLTGLSAYYFAHGLVPLWTSTNGTYTTGANTNTLLGTNGIGSKTIPANTLKFGSRVSMWFTAYVPSSTTITNALYVDGTNVANCTASVAVAGQVTSSDSFGFKVVPFGSGYAMACYLGSQISGIAGLKLSAPNIYPFDPTVSHVVDAINSTTAGVVTNYGGDIMLYQP